MGKFDLAAFEIAFAASLEELTKAENITKRELRDLSRTVLVAHHETGDVSWINRLLGALSPVNRRAAVLFYEEFSGFTTNDTRTLFVKKNKKQYDDAKAKSVEFLEDPNNNIWTWSARNVEMEKKPFAIEKVGQVIKKAIKEQISQADIIREVLKNGVELDSIIAFMAEMVPEGEREAVLSKVADGFGMEIAE